jgi:hypothetical protein
MIDRGRGKSIIIKNVSLKGIRFFVVYILQKISKIKEHSMKRAMCLLVAILSTTCHASLEGKLTYGEDLVNGHIGMRKDIVSGGLAVTGLFDQKFASDHVRLGDVFVGGFGEIDLVDAQSLFPNTKINGSGYVGMEAMYTIGSDTNLSFIVYSGVEVVLTPKITWCTEYRYSKRDDDLPQQYLVSTGPRVKF